MTARRANIQLLIAGTLLLTCACRQQPPERKYIAVRVQATHIDVDTGIVTVEWTDPRSNEIRARSGKVTLETEIFINGISARLEDVRVGDRATVTVYPTFAGSMEQWIVTRVSVDREDSFMLSRPIPSVAPAQSTSTPK